MGNEIVKQATANNSEKVVIAPKINGNMTKTEVSIPASTLSGIAGKTGASVVVSTPVADITISNGGLSGLSGAGGTVTVAAERTGSGMTITVPVSDAVPGTVAILVQGDGTRQVIRKSVASDRNITIPLDGGRSGFCQRSRAVQRYRS